MKKPPEGRLKIVVYWVNPAKKIYYDIIYLNTFPICGILSPTY
ncbi:MAG: hypothetical protein JWP81_4574 [Ferruginibacter sp.]|nr:hypothetical protein [Ferruginibacter sp.]